MDAMNTERPWLAASFPTRRKAHYIMIGGFLGAGKTTAIAQLARRLTDQGRRVGLITNDQGRELVDTKLLRSRGFCTEEISGGCFCCRFDSLVAASERLKTSIKPEVFLAEPVGSCTDIAATVTYPLGRLYSGNYSIAPLSVMVDPIRAQRVFGLEPGASFSDKVLYIYRKQLEEADLIIISKCDLLEPAPLEALRQAIAAKFPRAEVLAVSARQGTNLDGWFDRITSQEQTVRNTMEVDYDTYADGEALLGWFNGTAQLSAPQAFSADAFLQRLASEVQQRLQTHQAEIAHLKMTLSSAGAAGDLAVVNLVRNDFVPEISQTLKTPMRQGQLTINLRAEAAPDTLGAVVREALTAAVGAFATMEIRLDHLEQFRPGRPNPTHRVNG